MFYQTNVDIASTKSMWNFLKNHFQYDTMNSWNRQKSIANNVKLYNLNLEGDWGVAMRYIFDNNDCGGLQMLIEDEIRAFEEEHTYYKVFFNGRSSGYLVLCNVDNNCSVLPECVEEFDTYEEFKEEVKSGWNYWNVKDFNPELRETVEIVREFDRLCDHLRDIVNEYSLKSFDADRLESAVECFYCQYETDLSGLELTGPEMDHDRVKLNDIKHYFAFMHCFLECLGEDSKRIAVDSSNEYLWLREN